ncbi:MAG: hypothetical protein A3F83_00565 [Candidatus Glassbacteria bacterium RIFCSPLOWO2_12_FULL_58_11]|uniref:Uncharacterized protein n=2 Tax=Candidatus Glassiibacteriota TaxID=1817805 RepID=A0A1F5YPJ3_9BACT|nr:MAG: hypothetical protein A2Z86_11960 [Candidatus Glassbacteria bacterium GWA2_58_10]OGG02128.1 MAG: hypothetical protein A3F83_00565 [Candidatus Glassbacteria bacterium RIFCSPLOWO2_12_FULL_58_11]
MFSAGERLSGQARFAGKGRVGVHFRPTGQFLSREKVFLAGIGKFINDLCYLLEQPVGNWYLKPEPRGGKARRTKTGNVRDRARPRPGERI